MRVVIVGTGTEIGKTHVACALLQALVVRGDDARGLKPVESGVGGEDTEDAARLAAASGRAVAKPRYAFADALSPHLAARRAGERIDLGEIARWVAAHPSAWQIVETAGGLLSPLSPDATNLDLVRALAPAAIVVVAADRLGALHDVSAVLAVLAAHELAAKVVCLSAPPRADTSTGTNAGELATLAIARPVPFPRAPLDDPLTRTAANATLERL